MPAARGLKRTASKASGSGPAKIKKKNGVHLDVPKANKVRGRLLTCGQGDVGQLGLGEDLMETSRFTFVSALGEKVVDACAGGMHTVALDSDGTVWTFGCNDEGALGRTTSGESDEFNPGKVELPLPAVAISAGDSHTAALLNNGDVYVWGSFRDSHGSMGLLAASEGKPRAAPALLAGECARVASGGDHVVALRRVGALLSLGCPEQGQLGRVPARSASRHARAGLGGLLTPTVVPLKNPSRNIWAGSHATLSLDANTPKVFAWGLNNYNQLGVTGSKKKGALYAPTEADAFVIEDDGENDTAEKAPWAWVACGQHHSLALDGAGKCFAVGRCEYGRLGLGEGSGDAERLVAVPTLAEKKCISIAAGTSTSFAVTDKGEVFAWGMGSEGQLGTGAEEDVDTPRLITGKALQGRRAVKVSAGGQHTVLLVANVDDGSDGDAQAAVSTSSAQEAEAKPSPSEAPPSKKEVEESQSAKDEVTSSTAERMEVDEETKPAGQPVSRRRGRVSASGTRRTPGRATTKETKAKASVRKTPNTSSKRQ